MPDVKTPTTASRRERLLRTTRAELSAAARDVVVEQGVEAVTLKEVAGRLGMTAPAIYRYFPSREALLERVIVDLYSELGQHLAAARDAADGPDVGKRLVAMSRAFRRWALDHRAEFGLLFGAPIRGVAVAKEARDDAEADAGGGPDFGQVWFGLFAEIAASGSQPQWPRPIPPSVLSEVQDFLGRNDLPISPEIAMIFAYCWQSLYGAVCIEAFEHVRWMLSDAEELFENRLSELLELLGLPAA